MTEHVMQKEAVDFFRDRRRQRLPFAINRKLKLSNPYALQSKDKMHYIAMRAQNGEVRLYYDQRRRNEEKIGLLSVERSMVTNVNRQYNKTMRKAFRDCRKKVTGPSHSQNLWKIVQLKD